MLAKGNLLLLSDKPVHTFYKQSCLYGRRAGRRADCRRRRNFCRLSHLLFKLRQPVHQAVQRNIGSHNRVSERFGVRQDFLSLYTKNPSRPTVSITAENICGNVTLQHVSFSYSPERELIKDLNLNVKSGQRIAIVGPTGCGKTTVINLLMRFYDVDGGKITVDGENVQKLTRRSLRRSFGMVLQDTWLKNRHSA